MTNYGKSDPDDRWESRHQVQEQEELELLRQGKKKKGFFSRFRKKPAKPKATESIASEHLFREINLFIPEVIGLVIAMMAAVMAYFLPKVILASSLEGVKGAMAEATFLQLSDTIAFTSLITTVGLLVPVGLIFIFFMIRFMYFQSTRSKFFTLRVKRSGAVRLSMDNYKDIEIPFDRTKDSDRLRVKNPKKHWNEATGKPVVVLIEGDSENSNLLDVAKNISERGRDINTVDDSAFALGRRYERYNQDKSKGPMSTTNMLLIVMLAGMVGIGFLVFKNSGALEEMSLAMIPWFKMGLASLAGVF